VGRCLIFVLKFFFSGLVVAGILFFPTLGSASPVIAAEVDIHNLNPFASNVPNDLIVFELPTATQTAINPDGSVSLLATDK